MFESGANVEIYGPMEKKLKKLEEQKSIEEKEKRVRDEKEKEEKEKEEKLEEALKNCVNRRLSVITLGGKVTDKDSGLKIGEEYNNGSEYESECKYASVEEKDFYEEDTLLIELVLVQDEQL